MCMIMCSKFVRVNTKLKESAVVFHSLKYRYLYKLYVVKHSIFLFIKIRSYVVVGTCFVIHRVFSVEHMIQFTCVVDMKHSMNFIDFCLAYNTFLLFENE